MRYQAQQSLLLGGIQLQNLKLRFSYNNHAISGHFLPFLHIFWDFLHQNKYIIYSFGKQSCFQASDLRIIQCLNYNCLLLQVFTQFCFPFFIMRGIFYLTQTKCGIMHVQ